MSSVYCIYNEHPHASRFGTLDQEVEDAYEQLKAQLLGAAAAGRESLEVTETELQRGRRVRRIAQSALKADRRLVRWRPASPTEKGGDKAGQA